jgi:hypothetical protein
LAEDFFLADGVVPAEALMPEQAILQASASAMCFIEIK